MRAVSAPRLTSAVMASASAPSARTSPATVSARSVALSTTATLAPSPAKRSTVARPMPEPPPVTNATLSFNRMPRPSQRRLGGGIEEFQAQRVDRQADRLAGGELG